MDFSYIYIIKRHRNKKCFFDGEFIYLFIYLFIFKLTVRRCGSYRKFSIDSFAGVISLGFKA